MPAPSPKRPRSLIELLRKRIIDAIGIVAGPGTWCVVVADRPSLSIVSTVLKMHAIMEHNVVAVQLLSRSRQPYPEMDAVYILVPTADSVARAVEDFSPAPGAGRPRARKYARAHLLFTGALPEPLLARLRSSPAAPYIRTVSELFIEYNPIESRVFLTTPSEHPFHALYSPHALHAMAADLDSAADRVLSAVVSLGIRPHIRYYRPPPAAAAYEAPPGAMPAMGRAPACPRIAEAMAARIQAKLDEHQAREQSGRERPMEGPFPSVIIVLDRSVDMYAPLLHEFTYQAIVHDLIDLEGGTKYAYDITTAAGQPRHIEAELSEQSDLLWEKYRHWHISDLSQRLADKFEELVEGNASIRAAVDG
ncbi:syntaxin binding protein 1 [Coemansia javaensis]|uniref:Syntaxin binding protein 1 n=1 Tax=Coemansia javaensis TaxID=2761396 RepID=A0A9W8LJP8_9FUNG|nr:syntaxin binding protein 1 [Coemansia javaensis]